MAGEWRSPGLACCFLQVGFAQRPVRAGNGAGSLTVWSFRSDEDGEDEV